MIGLVTWSTPRAGIRQKSVSLEESSILRMRFLRAEVRRTERTPEAVLRRRMAQAAKGLRKRGVTRAVFPEDFPGLVQAEKAGVRPVSTRSLRRRMAADWVGELLRQRNVSPAGARVAVTASQMTGELVRTVTELCLRHRYVLLETPYGGEELCRQLRRDYGAALVLHPDRESLETADVLVEFDPGEAREIRGPETLPLWKEDAPMLPLLLPPALEASLPENCRRDQLLSALLEAGAIRPGQMSVAAKSAILGTA